MPAEPAAKQVPPGGAVPKPQHTVIARKKVLAPYKQGRPAPLAPVAVASNEPPAPPPPPPAKQGGYKANVATPTTVSAGPARVVPVKRPLVTATGPVVKIPASAPEESAPAAAAEEPATKDAGPEAPKG